MADIGKIFGVPQWALDEARAKREAMLVRRAAAVMVCVLPHGHGVGGTVEVWMNADGSWECDSSCYSGRQIAAAIDAAEKALSAS